MALAVLDCLYSLLPTTVFRVFNKALMGIMGGEKPMPYKNVAPWETLGRNIVTIFWGLCFPLDFRLSRVSNSPGFLKTFSSSGRLEIRRKWAQNLPRDQNPDILVMPR